MQLSSRCTTRSRGSALYISTVEALQLDYEAGEGHLPPIPALGRVVRGHRTLDEGVQFLGSAERIPTQDTSFGNSTGDAHDIAAVTSTLSSQLHSAGSPSASTRYSDSGSSSSNW